MEVHRIQVARSARFFTLGPREGARELWYGLHGYGQLAAAFLEDLRPAASAQRLLVAPEGLARFYLRGGGGPIGASWMTREEREAEIADTLGYLDHVQEFVREASRTAPDARVTVLGFSQGAAAAARWAALGGVRPARLVLWGGAVPPDLDLAGGPGERLRRTDLVLVAGERDATFEPGRRAKEEKRLRASGIPFRTASFPGGHRLDRDLLAALASEKPPG